jgi:beta-xylosidase
MKKRLPVLLAMALCWCTSGVMAQTSSYKQVWSADKGNGTYVNPVLNADFPDIDAIRVGDTYYMVSTTMYHFPGATLLKSKDLVNWEYCANPLQKIDDNDAYNLMNGAHHYSKGQWAASLNYHDGKFYIYFICYGLDGVDNTQNILLTATDPEGKWTMKKMSDHYYDSGWLFDDGENGDGYLYVACGIGNIWVNKLNPKTLQKISDTCVISVGNGCEGSHMYHIGDYYYIYATYGGTEGSQTIFRSKNPMGPYEEHNGRVFANQKIHQGALIETQTGEWWTLLFKDAGSIGRIPYLEPVKWEDGWPIIGNNGVDVSKDGATYPKPNVGATYDKTFLPTNDAFTDTKLGMQWEWNHNPVESAWSLTERRGWLRLHTANVTTDLNWARNSLSQRILGFSPNGTPSSQYKSSWGIVKLDLSGMQEGDVAGLAVFQNPYSFIGVKMVDGQKMLYAERCTFDSQKLKKEETKTGPALTSDVIYLKAIVNLSSNTCKYYYSIDNSKWTSWGVTMTMRYTLDYFVGQRFYLFNYATEHLGGYVDFDWFSTEQKFSEEMYGIVDPNTLLTDEEKTMTDLSIATNALSVSAGSVTPLDVMCTVQTGAQENVASRCVYNISKPHIVAVQGGRLIGLKDGTTDITATYSDPMGNTKQVNFQVTVTTFPLKGGDFNPSLVGSGTYNERVNSLKTAANGLGGWHCPSGVDISDYQYLVVRLLKASTTKPSFRLYDADNAQASPYSYEMGTSKEAVIDLHSMKNAEGQTIDPSHIYLAGFSTNGEQVVYIKEVYLSNDGKTPATGIFSVENVPTGSTPVHYALDGRMVDATEPGIHVVQDGNAVRKVLVP